MKIVPLPPPCGRENLTVWLTRGAPRHPRKLRPVCNRAAGHEGAHVQYNPKTGEKLSEWVTDPAI